MPATRFGHAPPIESSVQLLVEGNDQRNFFEAMVERLKLLDVQVRDFGGVTELRRYLAAFVNEPGFRQVRRIGIVRDAEASAEGAFASVRSSLENVRLPVPDQPAAEALGEPSVAVLVLPPNADSGMLETLLCATFADTAVDRCIDELFECVGGASSKAPKRPDKARCRVRLATMPEPHLSVGVAAKRGYWDLSHSALEGVRTFLMSLCRSANAVAD